MIIIFLLTMLFALISCDKIQELSEKKTQPEIIVEKAPQTVAWLMLDDGEQPRQRLLSGVVKPGKTTQLSFESSGKINSVNVGLGTTFTKGQQLATLDTTNYQLQLQQAKAGYETAVASRDQAKREVKRFENLVRGKAAPKIQLENYRLQLRTAQQSINNTKAQIELAQKQLDDTVLVAPFDGIVSQQLAESGQLAGPQTPIFIVEAKGFPEVSLSIPEQMISLVSLQQEVIVRFPAQPQIEPLTAHIAEISSQGQYGAFPIVLKLHNPPEMVKPGMTAEVIFTTTPSETGFSVPPSALGSDQENHYFVYRIITDSDKHYILEKLPVTVDSFADNKIYISGGLASHDRIVRSGWSFLRDKQAVILMGQGTQIVNP